jgi:medium-chain acyl-[acyl-carrier-protein] hydrolase
MRLLCIPYAGGSARAFQCWRPYLRRDIELRPVELAGQGRRSGEPPYREAAEAADDIAHRLVAAADGDEYAVYGHSLGGLVAYEALHRLAARGLPGPRRLYVSACRPPQLERGQPPLHTLPDRQFLQALATLGGVPAALLDDPNAVAFYAPLVRNDYRIYEEYRYAPKPAPLSCAITVVVGEHDLVTTPGEAGHWRELSTGPVTSVVLAGAGHFFLDERAAEIVTCLNATLAPANSSTCGSTGPRPSPSSTAEITESKPTTLRSR